jgi:hypothetical protein
MSGPNAFSMRRAMSGVKAAFPRSRSERVARRTFRICAALETLRPRGIDYLGADEFARARRALHIHRKTLVLIHQSISVPALLLLSDRKTKRQFPVTVRLHNPLRAPLSGCSESQQPPRSPSQYRTLIPYISRSASKPLSRLFRALPAFSAVRDLRIRNYRAPSAEIWRLNQASASASI